MEVVAYRRIRVVTPMQITLSESHVQLRRRSHARPAGGERQGALVRCCTPLKTPRRMSTSANSDKVRKRGAREGGREKRGGAAGTGAGWQRRGAGGLVWGGRLRQALLVEDKRHQVHRRQLPPQSDFAQALIRDSRLRQRQTRIRDSDSDSENDSDNSSKSRLR